VSRIKIIYILFDIFSRKFNDIAIFTTILFSIAKRKQLSNTNCHGFVSFVYYYTIKLNLGFRVTLRMSSNLVQYVVLRKDLIKTLKWPTGALVAQGCHACTAAVHMFYEDPNTQQYLRDLDRMHKVVLEVGRL